MSGSATAPRTPQRITVIFLLYHASRYVPGLVEAIRHQRHPHMPNQSDWLEVIFLDNGSTDATGAVLREQLERAGSPSHYRVVTNAANVGYARAVNQAFGLVKTPYALTCHCDCLFGSDDYLATMLELLVRHPEAGTITGQPAIPAHKAIPFAEKVNLVAYLMDIFPAPTTEELVPVGFAEGRCDGFRLAAVEAAGFYDTSHHSAGEDQVLCAAMRRVGYTIYQAPRLRYFLSVSDEQDTVGKLIRHMELFGEKHPILVLRGGAGAGITGDRAGPNRRARTLLRLNQLLSAAAYAAGVAGAGLGTPGWGWGGALCAIVLWKAWIFRRHVRAVRFRPVELAGFVLLQPALDVAYAWGFARGLWQALTGRWSPGSAANAPG